MDDETGLPLWFRFAKEQLCDGPNADEPLFHAVIDYQVHCFLELALAEDVEAAVRESTMQFLRGFEAFFGQGGLQPRPMELGL